MGAILCGTQAAVAPVPPATREPRRGTRTLRHVVETPQKRIAFFPTDVTSPNDVLHSTPASAHQAAMYPIQCPLCFSFHRKGFRTSCCGHAVCGECALSHAKTKRGFLRAKGVPKGSLPYSCPYCASTPFQYSPIDSSSRVIRSYKESPATKAALGKVTAGEELLEVSPLSDDDHTAEITTRESPEPRVLQFDDGGGIATRGRRSIVMNN